jgi:uncharacterized YigZ family protein
MVCSIKFIFGLMNSIQYKTIDKICVAEFTDRNSRFIAYCMPIASAEEFKIELQKLKTEHPKAVHHCFAYRVGTDKNNFRSSDDGEPSGTAGRPILNQIDSFGVTNILIVVVRYFGGILLGVPGLINAYKSAAQAALQQSTVIEKYVEENFLLEFDYTDLDKVMNLVKQMKLTIQDKKIELFCSMKIAVPKILSDEFLAKISNIKSLKAKIIS